MDDTPSTIAFPVPILGAYHTREMNDLINTYLRELLARLDLFPSSISSIRSKLQQRCGDYETWFKNADGSLDQYNHVMDYQQRVEKLVRMYTAILKDE